MFLRLFKFTDNYFQEEPPKLQGSVHGWIQWHSVVSTAQRYLNSQTSFFYIIIYNLALFAASCRPRSFCCVPFCTAVDGESTSASSCSRWLSPGSTSSTTPEAINSWGCTVSWCKEYVWGNKVWQIFARSEMVTIYSPPSWWSVS